jgi:hypothetical protein
MKSIPKKILIDSLEVKVEDHIKMAIVEFQNLSSSVLLKPAQDRGWSIVQCFDHLNGYGHHYLTEIEKGIAQSNNDDQPMFRSTWLGQYFTKVMDPDSDSGKKKLSTFKNHLPKPNLDANKVIAEFIHQQEQLLGYLRNAKSKNLNSIRIPISISKWIRIRLGDVFQFLIAHNERHLRQAMRNKISQGN